MAVSALQRSVFLGGPTSCLLTTLCGWCVAAHSPDAKGHMCVMVSLRSQLTHSGVEGKVQRQKVLFQTLANIEVKAVSIS